MGYNKVILMGNLTRNPELHYTPNGTAVTTFGLATNRKFKQGEDLKEEVCFVEVTVFGKQAESASQYLTKGRMALVEGRLRQQRWEEEGTGHKRSKHDVIAESVTFVGGNPGGHDGAGEEPQA